MSSPPLSTLPLRAPNLLALLHALEPQWAARAAGHDRDASFPHQNFALLQQHGLIGQVAARAFGGAGAGIGTARQIVAAVARAEPATALVLTMAYLQLRAVGRPDCRWPQHLRERVSRDAVVHGALANSLRVEPALGSPARGGLPATVARATAGGWRIDGHKLYTTGIPALRWLAVWARAEDGAGGNEPRTGVFLLPRDAPGIRVVESWDHLGMRASGSHEVVFEDVPVPHDHAVDLRPASGWLPQNQTPAQQAAFADQQAWMALLLGTLYDGVAQAARDWLLGFLRQRAPGSLGAPLASLPRVQETVGEIAALLYANRLMLGHATELTDDGLPPSPVESGLLKASVTGHAVRAVELALKLAGNHGLSRHNPLERHYRDVLCSRVHTPQDDASWSAAGKQALAVHAA